MFGPQRVRPRRLNFTEVAAPLVCVLVCVLLSTFSHAAYAQALDPVVEEHLADAAEFYADETGTTQSWQASCGIGCAALKTDLRRVPTAPTDPVGPGVFKTFIDKAKSTIRAAWEHPAGKLVRGAGLVGANYYVWKVHVFGARERDFYVRVPAEAFTEAQIDRYQLVRGTESSFYPTYFEPLSPLPIGAVASWPDGGRGPILWQTGGEKCNEPGPSSTPPYVVTFSWHWNRCFERYDSDGNAVFSDLTAHGWNIPIDVLYSLFWEGPHAPDAPANLWVWGTEFTPAEIQTRLRELLADDEYQVVEDWISSVFGGDAKNPKDDYFVMPDCAGVTAATCTTRLRDAGLMGTITTTTLTSADAALGQLAGRVTDTLPTRGTEVAEGAKLKIFVNPSTLPKMTATETAVADALLLKNPDTINNANKKDIAKQCVKFTKAARRSSNDCTSLPILVQGNDTDGPARNEVSALLRNPSWVALNHRVTSLNTGWYRDKATPAPGCVLDQRPVVASQCDEFPFWSTLQAQNGTLNGGIEPSIRWVPRTENRRQGSVLRQFYSANAAGESVTFKGCNITAQNLTDPAPIAASTFLNVPLPAGFGIPSVGICNKP